MIGFAAPWWLAALLGVAAVGAALWRLLALRRRDVARFVAGSVDAVARTHARHVALGAVIVLALGLGVVAIARPRWGAAVELQQSRGADVVVVVDVSVSMLARDVSPSRIERAKLVMADLLDRLQGHRVGLVAFAGSGGTLLPITYDTAAARMFAEQLEAQAVDEPGTSLEAGVDRAVELLDAAAEGRRVAVVISDGEDHGGDPVATARAAAARAADAGVRIVAVSVGDEAGAEIPLDVLGTPTIKRDRDGAPAITRARPDAMAALAADGLLVESSDGAEGERIAAYVDALGLEDGPAAERTVVPERFQVVVLAVLVLLAVEYVVAGLRP